MNRRRLDAADVKRMVNILSVVARSVELRRISDGRWRGLCPFHAEKTPSFQVREREQRWKCFGCGEGGDVIDFVMRLERCPLRQALERLGGMETLPPPAPIVKAPKSHVIACAGIGCGDRVGVDVKDIPFLDIDFPSWRFKVEEDDIRGLCPRCQQRWRAARMKSADSHGAREVARATPTSGACDRAWGPAGNVAPG